MGGWSLMFFILYLFINFSVFVLFFYVNLSFLTCNYLKRNKICQKNKYIYIYNHNNSSNDDDNDNNNNINTKKEVALEFNRNILSCRLY